MPVKNVVAMVEGTDPQLKNEYVVLSAHYDHIGVAPVRTPKTVSSMGARDNALGTTALLSAAEYLAAHPAEALSTFCSPYR